MAYLYRVSQVLPPDRKHPFLINFKLSKNSGMILYRYGTFCRDINFFNETVFPFNSITATIIYIIFH
jgi:hypothetical protein